MLRKLKYRVKLPAKAELHHWYSKTAVSVPVDWLMKDIPRTSRLIISLLRFLQQLKSLL